MKSLNEVLGNVTSADVLKEDEYKNEADGLIYCAKCHTPRQHRIEVMGKMALPFIMCQCQREAYDREQAALAQRDFLDRVSRMKSSGLQDQALYDYQFANDLGYNPEIRYAHTYVECWADMQADNTGLLLWGDVGTGKSFFAGCIANALLEQCVPVLMTNFAKLLNALSGMYTDDRNTYIDSLNRYSLLIIDDLGVERSSTFAQEQVFHVIDSRYRSGKPLIVTTNLTLDELKHTEDTAKRRIYDRILERCVPIRINNLNIRQKKLRNSCNGQGCYFPKTLPSLWFYQTYQINQRARLRRDGADLNESVRKTAFSPARERRRGCKKKTKRNFCRPGTDWKRPRCGIVLRRERHERDG